METGEDGGDVATDTMQLATAQAGLMESVVLGDNIVAQRNEDGTVTLVSSGGTIVGEGVSHDGTVSLTSDETMNADGTVTMITQKMVASSEAVEGTVIGEGGVGVKVEKGEVEGEFVVGEGERLVVEEGAESIIVQEHGGIVVGEGEGEGLVVAEAEGIVVGEGIEVGEETEMEVGDGAEMVVGEAQVTEHGIKYI